MKSEDIKKRRMLELRDAGDRRLERRYFTVSELRVIRADEGNEEPTKIVGHSAVFNEWSEDLGGFREKVLPGAFKKSIKRDDVRGLWNHNTDFVLGRSTVSKTLTLVEDATGLAIECVPPDTQLIRDLVLAPIERGDVSQMSFGFYTIKDRWTCVSDEEWKNGKLDERELIECELFDVSPVTFPAYPQTDVGLRSLNARRAIGEEPSMHTIDDILNKATSGETLSDDEKSQVNSAIEALQGIGEPPASDDANSQEGEEASQSQDLTTLKTAIEIEKAL